MTEHPVRFFNFTDNDCFSFQHHLGMEQNIKNNIPVLSPKKQFPLNSKVNMAFKTSLLILFISVFSLPSYSQYYNFEHMKTVNHTGHILSSDDRGNLLIGSQNNVVKLDANGDYINQYYPMFHGKVSCIDTKDPRRILVYYKEYSYVIFLNQDMVNAGGLSIYHLNSKPEPVNLDDLNLPFVRLSCLDEYNEAYWVYDENTSDIILIDHENRIDFRGDALDEYTELDPNPNYMLMESNRLFINNPASGVYIFDENGSFVRKLPLMGLKKIQAHGDKLFYASNSFLVVHDLVSDEETYHPLPVLNFKDWSLSLDSKPARINFLTADGVMIYSMELEN